MEIWKDIKDYEDYQVSNQGNVKSLKFGKELLMKLSIDEHGYNFVQLSKKNRIKFFRIHRLVYENFIGELVEDLVIDHINGITTQNNIENLQQISSRANINKGFTTKNTSSKYPGVTWQKQSNKWRSRITLNGKLKHLGYFHNEEEAAAVYQAELSKINF